MGSALEAALVRSAPDVTVGADIEHRLDDVADCRLAAVRTGGEDADCLELFALVARSASATARAEVGADGGDRLPVADAAGVPAPARWCTLASRA